MQIKYSVVIPLYNKASHINRSIDSVLKQTNQDFEIIVVNDGSSDGGEKKVLEYNDPRIKIHNQRNAGVSVARNKGMELSSGEYIAFLDADDEWLPNHLEEINTLIAQFPDAKLFSTAFYQISPNGEKESEEFISLPKFPWRGYINDYLQCLYIGGLNPIWTSTVVIEKSMFDKIKGFSPNMKIGEDCEFWIKIHLTYPCVFSSEYTAIYYKDSENRSDALNNYFDGNKVFVDSLQKMLDNDVVPKKVKNSFKAYIGKFLYYYVDYKIVNNNKLEGLKILLNSKYKIKFYARFKLLLIACIPTIVFQIIRKGRN